MNVSNTGRPARPRMLAASLAIAVASAAVPALASGPGPYVSEPPLTTYDSYGGGTASWEGTYAGISLGYACCGRDRVQLAPAPPGVIGTMHEHGAFFGLHVGQDWQQGDRVYGVEGSLTFSRIGDDLTNGTADARVRVNPVAEVRGRYGRAAAQGLAYLTGGVALGRVDYHAGDTAVPSDINSTYTSAGLSVGLGYERMLGGGWSMRGEYSYTRYRGRDLSDGVQTTRATPDYHAIRFGLNRRF